MDKLIIIGVLVLITLCILGVYYLKSEKYANLISDEILKGNLPKSFRYYDIDN